MTISQPSEVVVTIGVDTHAEGHVAVALDQLGRRLGCYTLPTTEPGYAGFLHWASQLGEVHTIGMEGTGSYGAGLSRWLRARGLRVVEVERPKRQAPLGRVRGSSQFGGCCTPTVHPQTSCPGGCT